MDSILTSIKLQLGIYEEIEDFDQQIIMAINSVFLILNQLGIGPEEGFSISDASTTWRDYLEDDPNLEAVKTYIGLKVKLLFDPPTNTSHIEAIKHQLAEFEWRLNIYMDAQEDE